MKIYGAQIWQHINTKTGLLFFQGSNTMLYQAAAVQIFAYLALPSFDATLS